MKLLRPRRTRSVLLCVGNMEPTYRRKVRGEDLGGYVLPFDIFLDARNLYEPRRVIIWRLTVCVEYLKASNRHVNSPSQKKRKLRTSETDKVIAVGPLSKQANAWAKSATSTRLT